MNIHEKIRQAKEGNLTKLYLGNSNLISLPYELFSLTSLSELYLQDNQIEELPREITRLTNLKILNLSNNKLRALPQEVTALCHLSRLFLAGNQLTGLPSDILALGELTELYLGNNKITDLPSELSRLQKLSVLDLKNNRLDRFPSVVTQLPNLTVLDLIGNKLTYLPDEIESLSRLEKLYLGRNLLTSLPSGIAKLLNLSVLVLTENRLESLPPEISQMSGLMQLSLSANRLKYIPPLITKLPRLILLGLADNPLADPPIEIAVQGLYAVKNYYKSKEEGSQKLYEAKLIILGQNGIGKALLSNKLSSNQSIFNYNQHIKQGIDINKWSWNWIKNGEHILFTTNLWDFDSRIIYRSSHKFFLTKRSLYVLVWDLEQEDDAVKIDYWLNAISQLSENSPIIIALNGVDENAIKEINQDMYIQKYKNIVCFFPVCFASSKGIEELIQVIKKEITKLPLVGADWPQKWSVIKKLLEEDKRNYISIDEFLNICSSQELNKEHALLLSQYLHDLGIIFHYQDDRILKNTVILKPEWGINAVDKVLECKKVQDNNGWFSGDDLNDIWENSVYPSEKYNDLLHLMMKFELCFRFENTNEYILPELLPFGKPENLTWDDGNNLKFEYHYDFMPAGIITRFIVRMHECIEGKSYWRNGVILNQEETRALVVCEPLQKKVLINIKGLNVKELFAYIRINFEQIHKRLNLDVREMLACKCELCEKDKKPFLFEYKLLKQRMENNKKCVECGISYKDISIDKLLSGYDICVNFSEYDTFERRDIRVMGDINIAGQVGVMGSNAKAENVTFNQFQSGMDQIDQVKLVEELSRMKEVMKTEAQTDEQLIEVGKIVEAELAAKEGNHKKLFEALKATGKWTTDVATNITAKVVAAVIAKTMGLP